MAKAILKDGKVYRLRRGKLVEIPPEWVGRHTTKKTIRQRKLDAKARKNRSMRIKNNTMCRTSSGAL